MKNNKPDAELVWKQLDDVLVPRLGLNITERVVYAHLLRHSRLEGKRQLRFSIVWLARSVRLSDQPARHAVRSLAAKGALRLVDRTQAGHLAEVFLPEEIHAAPPESAVPSCLAQRPGSPNLEEMDFLQVSSRREAIHARERGLCFYCLRRFVARGRLLDHVVPQARGGGNSYRNLVSCCVECNSQKGETAAEDFLRTLFRLRRLTSVELEGRLRALDALAAGKLRPIVAPPAVVITERKNS
jgi:5-methylcytosine-specific restriction endonuclease McrA/predicted DNA-binding transcriptional regulator